jgi:cytochrome c oxidase cbb3-type subunit 3
MPFINEHTLLKRTSLCMLFSLTAIATFARGGGVAPAAKDDTNWLVMLMVFIAVVLLFVIWGLGQVLITLNRQLMEKTKDGKIPGAAILIIGLTALSGELQAQTGTDAANAAEKAANYGGLSGLEFFLLSTVIGLEVMIILFLALMARRTWRSLTGEADKLTEKVSKSKSAKWWNDLDKRFFTRAVPVEKEADVMLDHDYDGIRELDNALPPWWKWGFYVTVILAVIYMFNFHVFGTGKDPEQEYAAEMAEGKRLEELYKARTKDLVDENNVTMTDADGIAAGRALFTQSCVACHAADGGGGIGPNLTDDNWIHGGAMNDIYKTIKLGYPEKGMQSWQSVYSPVQIRQLTSFVRSLKGTKPASPKEAQGEAYKENTTAAVPGGNASAGPSDSTGSKK